MNAILVREPNNLQQKNVKKWMKKQKKRQQKTHEGRKDLGENVFVKAFK
jgi:hypothetical protein